MSEVAEVGPETRAREAEQRVAMLEAGLGIMEQEMTRLEEENQELQRINDSLRLQRDAALHNGRKDNEYLIAQRNALFDALAELVALKNIKDDTGPTEDYLVRQPLAWAMAREVVCRHREAMVRELGDLDGDCR